MQKLPALLPLAATPAIAAEPLQGGGPFRRRLTQSAAGNLYEKEREEQPGVRLRARRRALPEEDASFDGTGCFSDS